MAEPDAPDLPTPKARPVRPRRFGWTPVLGGLGALLFVAGMGYLAFRPSPAIAAAQSLQPRAVVVVATTLSAASSYAEQRTHTGRVEAPRISPVGSELGGTVLEVLVDEGDLVSAGQPVVRLDTKRLVAQRLQRVAEKARQTAIWNELRAGPRVEDIRAQEAACRQADAAAALAEATAQRIRKARDEDAVSEQEWDDARLRAEQASAAAEAARAVLAELEAGTRPERVAAQSAAIEALDAAIAALDVDVAKATIRAPFAARVTRRLAEQGRVISPGTPLLELREVPPTDNAAGDARGQPEIRVGVMPALARSLVVGDTVPIRVRGNDARAKVLAVRTDQSVRTRTVPVLLSVQSRPNGEVTELHDGELVEVVFQRTIDQPGLWVPTTALSEGVRGLWRCFVLAELEGDTDPATPADATHRLATRVVEILHFDEHRAYVRGTLEAGDRVVTDGTHRLMPGLAIRVQDESGR